MRARSIGWKCGVLCAWLVCGTPEAAKADARTDYLVRLLETSTTFRVRAQAALSLGRVQATPRIKQALKKALADAHPAVRIAAVASLARSKDPHMEAAIRALQRDREVSVRAAANKALEVLKEPSDTEPGGPAGTPAYYVAVGNFASNVKGIPPALLGRVRAYLVQQLRGLGEVQLAPDGEPAQAARALIKKRQLRGYFIETSLASLEESGDKTRARVSLIVATYPGRDMRAMLEGSASVSGGAIESRREPAIKGAMTGALRRVPEAMQSSRPGL